MTDKQIIKALECCCLYEQICPETCPMINDGQCISNLRKGVFDLIHRQQAVIDRQKDHIELLEIEKQTLKEDSDKAKATAVGVIKRLDTEIERLKEKLNHSIGVNNTKENGCFPFD